jgi:hypothetical protein
MSNENHNNTGNWRSKLEALDNLPGETIIDKNASWEKLHDRLREKKGTKKIIWYWSAAACLLLVLMIPLINSNKKDHKLVNTGTAQKQVGIKSAPAVLIDKKDSAQITSPASFEKNQSIAVAGKSIKKHQVVPVGVDRKIYLGVAVSNPVFMKETTITALQPLDTSLNIAAARPVNKKLKVVHINELGDPLEESPGMARNAEIHSFQLKLASQEVYVNASVASRAGGFLFSKSKTSPKLN